MKPERLKFFKKHLTAEKLLKNVDVEEILQKPANGKKSPEEIADEIIDVITAATPWSVLIPGVGLLIDALEGPILKALAHKIILEAVKKKQKKLAKKKEES